MGEYVSIWMKNVFVCEMAWCWRSREISRRRLMEGVFWMKAWVQMENEEGKQGKRRGEDR
jgi:hypothetical protein